VINDLLGRISRVMSRIIPYPWIVTGIDPCLSRSARIKMLGEALSFVCGSGLAGDYLEFGVYRGKTFTAAYHLAQTKHLDRMRFYAFDSFLGLPSGSDDYELETNRMSEGDTACSQREFLSNIRKDRVDMDRVTIVPGWFSETLNDETKKSLPIEKVAIAWIDCDLYESTMPVLEFITDYLDDGSLLIFDDWFFFAGDSGAGEQRAVNKWLERHPTIRLTEYRKFGWHGNSFIVRRGSEDG